MASISPVVFPIKGTATKINLIVLNFSMDATTASFYYSLTDDNDAVIADGNLHMDEQEYAGWGADNSYCIAWAANKLGLTLI